MPAIHIRTLHPGQKIRVLVVDDSVVIRRLICHALEEEPAIEVVGVAANGKAGLDRIGQTNPDVVTLDIEMPEMDGLEMLRRLRSRGCDTRVIMFSTMTQRGASATLDALWLGADDYVTKASNTGSLEVSLASLREQLIPKIRQFFRPEHPRAGAALPAPPLVAPAGPLTGRRQRVEAIAIGVSTGGPTALSAIIPQFPAGFGVPIFIVQHMPPLFTALLAERLNGLSGLAASEAVSGEVPRPGRIYVAPGDYHMKVASIEGRRQIVLDQSAPQNSCRPAVDALFSSLAEVYGGGVVAAVLTGMGQDGLRGAQELRERGAHVLAQDEASSVVWGMPGAVATAGVAHQVLPLREVVPAILQRMQGA